MKAFEGKLHTVAGEWASIPITTNNQLFKSMVSIGKAMAAIEKNDYIVSNEELLNLLGEQTSLTIGECEVHNSKCEDGKIKMFDEQNRTICTIEVPKNILNFEASGYNIIEQWLKYHSYAYYRKSCNDKDIRDLFNLIGKIYKHNQLVTECDTIMKSILKSELLKPIR